MSSFGTPKVGVHWNLAMRAHCFSSPGLQKHELGVCSFWKGRLFSRMPFPPKGEVDLPGASGSMEAR